MLHRGSHYLRLLVLIYCLWLPLQLRRPDLVVQYGPGLVNYVDSREGSAMIHS
jgi:hypothetical protein